MGSEEFQVDRVAYVWYMDDVGFYKCRTPLGNNTGTVYITDWCQSVFDAYKFGSIEEAEKDEIVKKHGKEMILLKVEYICFVEEVIHGNE